MATQVVTTEHIINFLNGVADLSWLDKATFEAIGEELLLSTRERFANEESPTGQKWKSLSKAQKRRKQKRDYGDKILSMRGHLKDLLRFQATDKQVQIGSDRKYAAIHQYGGKFTAFGKYSAKMPARPFLGVSEDDREAIRETVREAWEIWQSENL